MTGVWDTISPYHQLGLNPGHAPATVTAMPGVERSAGPGLHQAASAFWHPDSPLFWFGVLAAATIGLVAASTSIRVGPVKGSVGVGK